MLTWLREFMAPPTPPAMPGPLPDGPNAPAPPARHQDSCPTWPDMRQPPGLTPGQRALAVLTAVDDLGVDTDAEVALAIGAALADQVSALGQALAENAIDPAIGIEVLARITATAYLLPGGGFCAASLRACREDDHVDAFQFHLVREWIETGVEARSRVLGDALLVLGTAGPVVDRVVFRVHDLVYGRSGRGVRR